MIPVILLHIALCGWMQPDCVQQISVNDRSPFPHVVHTSNGDFVLRYEKLETPLYGITFHNLKLIQINFGQASADERDTVIHECLHAELGFKWDTKKMRGHEAVYEAAHAMQRLLQNNPELAAYLGR